MSLPDKNAELIDGETIVILKDLQQHIEIGKPKPNMQIFR